jgi:type IV secretory pathway VirB3-like protein
MGIELGVRVSAGIVIVIVIVIGKGIAINFIASQVHASELGIVVMSRTTHLATESI